MPAPPMTRLMMLNAKEWYIIVIGCISSLAQGAVQPAFALVFGIMIGVSKQLAAFLIDLSSRMANTTEDGRTLLRAGSWSPRALRLGSDCRPLVKNLQY